MTPTEEIADLLKEHHAVLERRNKHRVWRLPDGRIWVEASTPSDFRAERNNLAQLRRFLGVKRETNKNPDRVQKKGVRRKFDYESIPPPPDWKEKLRRLTAFKPKMDCYPLDIRVVPMTPVWCIMRNLIGYGGRR